jgi:hypothetical protein
MADSPTAFRTESAPHRAAAIGALSPAQELNEFLGLRGVTRGRESAYHNDFSSDFVIAIAANQGTQFFGNDPIQRNPFVSAARSAAYSIPIHNIQHQTGLSLPELPT